MALFRGMSAETADRGHDHRVHFARTISIDASWALARHVGPHGDDRSWDAAGRNAALYRTNSRITGDLFEQVKRGENRPTDLAGLQLGSLMP